MLLFVVGAAVAAVAVLIASDAVAHCGGENVSLFVQ